MCVSRTPAVCACVGLAALVSVRTGYVQPACHWRHNCLHATMLPPQTWLPLSLCHADSTRRAAVAAHESTQAASCPLCAAWGRSALASTGSQAGTKHETLMLCSHSQCLPQHACITQHNLVRRLKCSTTITCLVLPWQAMWPACCRWTRFWNGQALEDVQRPAAEHEGLATAEAGSPGDSEDAVSDSDLD